MLFFKIFSKVYIDYSNFSVVEELREALHKKVDALDLKQLDHNMDLLHEILKDGIKIYCQR